MNDKTTTEAGAAATPELKPCPFCGTTPIVDCTEDHSESRRDTWLVCCGTDACYGNAFLLDLSFHSKEHACEAWNTRAEPATSELTKALADLSREKERAEKAEALVNHVRKS